MKKIVTYLLWSLLALVLVFASVAVPVALSKKQEKEITNKVTILSVEEPSQNYLSYSVSLAERVSIFADTDLTTQIARNAYISELSMEDAVSKMNTFLLNWIAEYKEVIEKTYGITTLDVQTILSGAVVNAVLYESPSGSTKMPYWQVEYQWKTNKANDYVVKYWPLYYVKVICDTRTGEPYLIYYEYIQSIPVNENCGIIPFAKALGLENQVQTEKVYPYRGSFAGNVVMDKVKINYYYEIKDQYFCIIKSITGTGAEQIQLLPRERLQ